jgi:hypothetical protein
MQDEPTDLERMLRRYRPAGPSSQLRETILAAGLLVRPRTRWFGRAAAAVVLFSLGLNFAAERLNRTTALGIGIGPAHWTADAENVANLIGGDEAGRRYLAFCLIGSGNISDLGRNIEGG